MYFEARIQQNNVQQMNEQKEGNTKNVQIKRKEGKVECNMLIKQNVVSSIKSKRKQKSITFLKTKKGRKRTRKTLVLLSFPKKLFIYFRCFHLLINHSICTYLLNDIYVDFL